MIIIEPLKIDNTNLIASNANGANDPAEWDVAQSYSEGDRVKYEGSIYQASVDIASHKAPPDQNPDWVFVSVENKFRMFDSVISTFTENPNNIQVTIRPAQIVNGISFFGLEAATVRVQYTDANGTVYDETFSLVNYDEITDYHSYVFEEVGERQNDLLLLDLPTNAAADITITIDNGQGLAQASEVVLGRQNQLGVTNFGTSIGLRDFSRKEFDQFGNPIITERRFIRTADYDVTMETGQINRIQRKLADIRATPVVYIGDQKRPETVIFGFYKNFNIVISEPSICSATIEVEGLA